jgi:hypothetical protein
MTQLTANGTSYSDDGSTPRDMNNGGFRQNLLPMLSDTMIDASGKVAAAAHQVELAESAAAAAAVAASTAVSGPGSTGTSATSLTIALGVQSLVIQSGKTLSPGMPCTIASTASPRNWMNGSIDSYNAATGALQVFVTNIGVVTPGVYPTLAAWSVSLSGPAAVSGVLNELKGAAIASAATINLDAATGNYVHLTGSTGPVTAVTLAQGAAREVTMDSTPTFVHSPTLDLPTKSNIKAQAGDVVRFRGEGGGAVKVTSWTRANGDPLFISKQFRTAAHLPASGTWVAPGKGVLRITLAGAFGSGAVATTPNDSTSSAAASGASAPGLAIKSLHVEAGDAFVFTGAAGGAQVSTSTAGARLNGNDAGTSTITGPNTSMTANGGKGGIGAYSASGPVTAPGVTGGTASGGDVNYTGGGSGDAVVAVSGGVAATGAGAIAWNGVGYASGTATVSAGAGSLFAASGGAGTGGASGTATAGNSAPGISGGGGAAGPSAAASNSFVVSTPGPGYPAMLASTPLAIVAAGNTVGSGAGGNAMVQTSSAALSTAGGPLAGGGAAIGGNVGGVQSAVAAGGQGGGTGGAVGRLGTAGSITATAQAGANAFAIFEWSEA